MKDINKTVHWVGQSKLKTLYVEDCFKIKTIINELEAILTGDTIELSDSGIKNNPYLLQESEVENADAYLTADSSNINEDNDNMNISMEEDQETEIIKKLKLDVKILPKTKIKR